MSKYTAIINIPGYLPQDDAPPVFDAAREAWEYLAEERKREEDTNPDESGYTETLKLLRRLVAKENWYGGRIDPNFYHKYGIAPDGTGMVWGPTPGYDGTHDLGVAYSVEVVEEP